MEGAVCNCMNGMCASSNSIEWKKGWPLRSGDFATLCHTCGTAYKNLVFCEMFHSEETGWRECSLCGKRLHCGCIASSPLLELLDTGGVSCKGCSRSSKLPSIPLEDKHEVHGPPANNSQDFDKAETPKSGDHAKTEHKEQLPPSWKPEDDFAGSGETEYKLLSTLNLSSIGPSKGNGMLQESKGATAVHRSLVQTNLSISLSASSNSNTLSGLIAEERELSSPISSFHQGCRPRHLIPRLPNNILAVGLESNSSAISQLRVARPPVEGRVKNQLLPRYWPRITDQELQQISGDSNSTIIPLFEKILSASDAGRIGRLVLPKACAEAYFPPISQPEGLPLRIQDVKGKEWVFQFRFWPNNNSRMYVLEGVTPCIQSMQLQAGDTVTFSRMDPEGKLLMGFRKASNSLAVSKGSHYSMTGGFQGESSLGNAEIIPIMSGYSSLLQSLNAGRHSSLPMLSKHVYAGNANPHIIENMPKAGDSLPPPQSFLLPERKRRNIGSKSRRLVIDGQDSMELRLSWEEVQDMLHPPPTVKPSTTLIEDHEFEEFEEPPVFAKSSIFVVRQSGEHQQWAQCDSCCKWRKLPFDLLLPPKWTCQDNIHDPDRTTCSAPDEFTSRELENLLKMNKEFSKRKLEPLTNTAPDVNNDQGASSVATTTKHPRHRPGCSCIVCIQPPSGKGKHKPTCMCNVCMTVKRRFKTLMMRKKKRLSEREAEIAQRNQFTAGADEAEVNSIPDIEKSESETPSRCQSASLSKENDGKNKGGLDLNCCPDGEHSALPRVSMMSLLHQASLPLETYLRQKGLTGLIAEQRAASPIVSQVPGESTAQAQDEPVALQELEDGSDELSEKVDKEDDPS